MTSLLDRHAPHIVGRLECLDRVIVTGTLPGICHVQGMTSYLYGHNIRIFDYTKFVNPLREQLRDLAVHAAAEQGLEIEYVAKNNFRKEERIRKIIDQRGDHPGLVHVFSAMEACTTYKARQGRDTGYPFLKYDNGKCLHYYFYFIDEVFGLCYLRVQTWCPFRLQFYFNGHHWLARQLDRQGIGYELLDNAFVRIDDFAKAQEMADAFVVAQLHRLLDRYAARCCPIFKVFGVRYHWSIMEAEYASDVVFAKPKYLQPLYEHISRTAIHTVKPDRVATFLGKKLDPKFEGELGNHFHTRIEGTCIKHHIDRRAIIKMYDKHGRVLRIETTVNDITFFKHHRKVEHRDGTSSIKQAKLKKTIYSLPTLVQLIRAANNRYLAFVSEIEDPTTGIRQIKKLTEPVRHHGRSFKGLNPFRQEDHEVLQAIVRGEHNISGMTNKTLRRLLANKTSQQISRVLKRLRLHGLIKRVGRSYKYYLTTWGRRTILALLKLQVMVLLPTLAQQVIG